MNGWAATKFGGQGDIEVEDGAIVIGMGADLSGVHWTNGPLPKTNYEISLEARRVSGSDFFCGLTFPVAESFCTLILGGWGGGVVGLSNIDGEDASENETTVYRGFKTGQWHAIKVRVTPEKIQAWIDEDKAVDVMIEGREVSLRYGDIERSKPLGMATWQTSGAVRNIRLREIRSAPAALKPNVIFINVDDLNTELGCYGNLMVKTPHIDRLARRGVLFDKAYCQYPVCNPSRISFFSGLRPETTGVMDQQSTLRETMPEVVFLPEHFRNHGYFTAGLGKNEHRGQGEIRWDVLELIEAQRPPRGGPDGSPTGRPRHEPAYFFSQPCEEDDPFHSDHLIARRTVELMEARRDQPFFIGVGFRRPHEPHVVPKRFFDLYPLETVEPVAVPDGDEKDIPPIALGNRSNYQPDMPDAKKREIMRAYLACVSYLDEQVGVILEALDRLKLWDSTVVVFFGDHGWHFGQHHWWAKASLFEPSARAPLIVAGPGVTQGKICPRVVEFLDFYPTLAELCSLPPPPQGEGRSFVPLLEDPSAPWDKPAFTAMRRPGALGRSVRTERHRYTEWDEGRKGVELYDYESDPGEHTNLARDPKRAKTVADLKTLLNSTVSKAQPQHLPQRRK